jgi:hypothetical protein
MFKAVQFREMANSNQRRKMRRLLAQVGLAPKEATAPAREPAIATPPVGILRVLMHPVTPILLGAGVTIAGSASFAIRSVCILVICVWAMVDWANYLHVKWIKVIGILGITITTIAIIGYWKTELLNDVKTRLHIEVSLPPNKGASESRFTVRNGSDESIGKHNIECNLVRYIGRVKLVGPGFIAKGQQFDSQLPPDDAHATECLSTLKTPMQCLDVYVTVTYDVDVWPHMIWNNQRKESRFLGRESGTDFVWQQEPLDAPPTLCDEPTPP